MTLDSRVGERDAPQTGKQAASCTGLLFLLYILFSASASATPSPGCRSATSIDTAPGTTEIVTMEYGGLQREYRMHLPPTYDGKKPMSLLLSVHGYTGSAEFSELRWNGLNQHADREGYVVVYPQSTSFEAELGGRIQNITSWNDLACNASPGPLGPTCEEDADPYPCPTECGDCGPCNWCSCNDDVGYIGALLDKLESDLCLDTDRFAAVGFSNGGMFVQRLGCALADRFAAVAPWAGTLARGFNCSPRADSKTSLLLLSGTEDRTVPLDGSPADDGYLYTPNAEVAASWAKSQACSASTEPAKTLWTGVGDLSCQEHRECETGAVVMNCQWRAAHDWPRLDGQEQPFGNELLWWFLQRSWEP